MDRYPNLQRSLEDQTNDLKGLEELEDTIHTSKNANVFTEKDKRRYNKAWFGRKRSIEEPITTDFDSSEEVDEYPLPLPKSYYIRFRKTFFPSRVMKRLPLQKYHHIYKKWIPMIPSRKFLSNEISETNNNLDDWYLENMKSARNAMNKKYWKGKARDRRAQAFTRYFICSCIIRN